MEDIYELYATLRRHTNKELMTSTEEIKKLKKEILDLEEERKSLERIDTYHGQLDPKVVAHINADKKIRERAIKLIKLLDN